MLIVCRTYARIKNTFNLISHHLLQVWLVFLMPYGALVPSFCFSPIAATVLRAAFVFIASFLAFTSILKGIGLIINSYTAKNHLELPPLHPYSLPSTPLPQPSPTGSPRFIKSGRLHSPSLSPESDDFYFNRRLFYQNLNNSSQYLRRDSITH